MPLNTIEYAESLMTALDDRFVETACSGWMDSNSGQVIYNGGNKVKIPVMSTTGLKDYDRDNGYPSGSVSLSYEELLMGMDRGTSFQLDAMDVNESNFIANATAVSSKFQKEQVVPEIDAYRYSKLAAYATAANISTYTPAAATMLDALLEDIAVVRDMVGENEPLVININAKIRMYLDRLTAFQKMIDVTSFKQGNIDMKVKSINEIPLLSVPSARFQDTYVFNDGKTTGQTDGGFTKASTAKEMNWIICPKKVPIAVSKQDKMKIFDPETYQKADAWFIGYRRYHELWVKGQQTGTIRVSKQA